MGYNDCILHNVNHVVTLYSSEERCDIMARKKENKFQLFLKGKKIPILTLDNKWHQLFEKDKKTFSMKRTEKELNSLIQKEGQLGNDIKDLNKVKVKLRNDILENMEAAASDDAASKKQQEKNQKLLLEVNDKIEQAEDTLAALPTQIDMVNRHLMLLSMENCYENLKRNDEKISELTIWINTTREQLKTKLLERQELQGDNRSMYRYMHDLFGAEIVDLFDLEYDLLAEEEEADKESGEFSQ